jgi:hypothetical protein
MASTISAGTTSGTAIVVSGDTTGNLELKTQAGANTITVPNSTGNMVLDSATQTLTNKSIVATQLTGTIAAARLPSGSVLQTVSNNLLPSVQFTTTSASYVTWATAPSATITLTNSANRVLITARIGMQFDAGDQIENTIYRIISGGSTTDLSNGNTYGLSFHGTSAAGGLYKETVITWIDTPSTASAITYTWYARAESSGLIYPDHGGAANTITLMEIAL